MDQDAQRFTLVREAARRWRGQLIDLGGRNALLYYRDLKAGTLDLGEANPTALASLLDGRRVALSQLFVEPERRVPALRRARTIRNKARELLEERGIETCFLAIGLATWPSPKAGAAPAAPVLLRSAGIRARGAAEDDFDLSLTGDVELNPTLVHLLATEFDVEIDAEQVEDLVDYRSGFDPAPVFERLVKEVTGRVPGFAVTPRHVLGTFSYAKLPMVTDLQAAEEVLAGHEVIAAVAGDRQAQAKLRAAVAEVAADPPDHLDPADEFLVLDADSSQHRAINAVLAGQHTVIKGPPGTGKSQTIANLIATLVARGQRVLFVAEKRAAIAAVTDRLARWGLDSLVMDVHDGTAARRRIAAQLRSALDGASRIALPDLTRLHTTLADRRARLNEHVAALHEARRPWGVSVFQAQAALLGIVQAVGESAATAVRLRGEALAAVDAATAPGVREQLREYASLGGCTLTPERSAWAGATVSSAEQAQSAYQTAGRLARHVLPAARAAVDHVTVQCGLRRPARLGDWRSVFTLLDEVAATLSELAPQVYTGPRAELIAACAPADWRRANPGWPGARAGWLARRRLRRQARALWRGAGRPSRERLFRVLLDADSQVRRWARLAHDGGYAGDRGRTRSLAEASTPHVPPRLPADFDRARAAHEQFSRDLTELAAALPAVDLAALSPDEAQRLFDRLAGDERTARRLPRLNALAGQFRTLGLEPLLVELTALHADADLALARFDYCWYASMLERVSFADHRIGAFDGALHGRTAAEFRSGDHEHIATTATRVLRAVAEHIVAARDTYPDESRLVEHQANLKRRHLPVRQLFAVAPHLLTALKPCWAMSPLIVSRLLPADRQYFDVVVFDEASQVTPADAVPAIMRARQVVVAGDEHQLPPTTFFTAADDPDDTPLGVTAEGAIDLSLTTGYESILDVLAAVLPGYTLRWHYRSLDERLIGFSNAWIYGRSLVTFPGASAADCLTHVVVDTAAKTGSAEVGPATTAAADAGSAEVGRTGAGADAGASAGAHPDDAAGSAGAGADVGSADAGTGESAGAEVRRVVELVLEHAANRPDESLGVIAMGITHAERIDVALRKALAGRRELHPFFAEDRAEPFFVKNLERVQGDERDAVLLSIGYGHNAAGRLLYRFGPLLTAGGERRLNVAVTRARRRMTVVSSFTAAEMDPERSTGEGVRLLRSYLQYAESGGTNLGAVAVPKPALDPFAVDVRDRLTAAGVPVLPQYGVAGDTVEFAAVHPNRPGEMVLAIETDGPGYRAAGSARDRDRLRQEHLQRLGWRYHRIWSIDWFADPAAEVERVRQAYAEAVAAAEDARPEPANGARPEPANGARPEPAAPAEDARPEPAEDARPEPSEGARPAPAAPAEDARPEPAALPVAPSFDAEQTVKIEVPDGRPGPRPPLPRGEPIGSYSRADLVALIRWIESDTLLRTEEEIVDEVVRELGFSRRGPRIREAVLGALAETRGPRRQAEFDAPDATGITQE